MQPQKERKIQKFIYTTFSHQFIVIIEIWMLDYFFVLFGFEEFQMSLVSFWLG